MGLRTLEGGMGVFLGGEKSVWESRRLVDLATAGVGSGVGSGVGVGGSMIDAVAVDFRLIRSAFIASISCRLVCSDSSSARAV